MKRLVIALTIIGVPTLAAAQVPRLLGYQGRLVRSDGTPEAGVKEITFALYDVAQGGDPLWSEVQQMAVSNGFYATFLGRQVSSDPLENQEQWRTIKRETTEAILAAGGTLSHHHGVGRDHAPWLEEEIGPLGMQALRALKETFDPANILNPGVLLS